MAHQALDSEVTAAAAYEHLFVPALFAQWAPRVADAAGVQAGQHVLDVACGTGVLAREVNRRVGTAGYVAGIDAGRGMLSVAEGIAPGVEWRHGTAESLPFPDGSFDRVVSQFGLMFFTDNAQALREMIRVLKPGGRLAVAVWSSLESIPAWAIEVEILDRLAGPHAAAALRVPFVLGDVAKIRATFTSAGITSPEIATHAGVARFPGIRTMVEADLRGWLPLMGISLREAQIRQILEEAEHALARYAQPDGSIAFDAPAHIATTVRP